MERMYKRKKGKTSRHQKYYIYKTFVEKLFCAISFCQGGGRRISEIKADLTTLSIKFSFAVSLH